MSVVAADALRAEDVEAPRVRGEAFQRLILGVLAPHAEPEGVAPQPAGVERPLGDAERPQRTIVDFQAAAFGNDARQDAARRRVARLAQIHGQELARYRAAVLDPRRRERARRQAQAAAGGPDDLCGNLRVDSTPSTRGDAGASPLDGASTAASSSRDGARDTLVDFHTANDREGLGVALFQDAPHDERPARAVAPPLAAAAPPRRDRAPVECLRLACAESAIDASRSRNYGVASMAWRLSLIHI